MCISHWKRRKISQDRQKEISTGKETIPIPEFDDPSYDCCIGTKLVGCSTVGKFKNGGRYTVVSLKPLMLEDTNGCKFEASAEQISKSTMLAHALTYQRVQGITTDKSVMLCGLESPFFQKSHLYVGLSRVTCGANVFVE